MKNLEELTNNPEFIYENMARASKAARGTLDHYHHAL